MRKTIADYFTIFLVVGTLVLVWPTRYRYHRFGQTVIRENRFTETMEMLSTEPDGSFGWVEGKRP